ncbi:type II secretion system F family protein [Paralimibaculum aggregatum]|uniref:Type II secretion system F family protein n=1 Tax=Paralimibaculum aggregatum TaxID=3036245 RepID=A0ABQ6LL11_9RHOB|nr:type II secretion system F family protein [Limibaculum sp. NKW23]GMG82940.1 type II secretion system F family protein [Limibaculum sp. NKW23]
MAETDAGAAQAGAAGAADAGEAGAALLSTPGFVEGFWNYLIENFGPSGPFYAIAALGMVLALVALPFVLRRQRDPVDRLGTADDRRDIELATLRTDRDSGALRGFEQYLEPTDTEELSDTRAKLASAGYKDRAAVRVYFFARAALGIGLFCFGMFFLFVVPKDPNTVVSITLSVAFGLMGYFLPVYWVERQIQSRREEIANAFPDAMDMMLVCIEGGQSLEQAMARVGKEMETASGPLAEELQIVSYEFRAGKDRIAVLRDFAARCAVNDISSFVTVLIQSTAFGTSISEALRVYASEMRDKRLMRAEEKANVLPTKLTLGTMMFTVPPLILILIGPSIIQIIRALSGLSR